MCRWFIYFGKEILFEDILYKQNTCIAYVCILFSVNMCKSRSPKFTVHRQTRKKQTKYVYHVNVILSFIHW